jgi:hypothetical protein
MSIRDSLNDVTLEVARFSKALEAVKKRFSEDKHAHYRCKESASLKRAAMDLKNELTKITQGTNY